MSADLTRLGAVLTRELQADAGNALVEGGLDELLRLQARDEQPGSPLLRMVAAPFQARATQWGDHIPCRGPAAPGGR